MTHRLFARKFAPAMVLMVGVCLAEPAPASDPAKDLVNKIEARYQKTTDLTAEFTQTLSIQGFASAMRSTGRVYLKRPGKLRWDYATPTREQIFVEHDTVQFYIPEHQQVLNGQLSRMADSQAPLQLLQGIGRLDEHYRVTVTPNGAKGDGGLPLLSLTLPKGGSNQPRIVIEVEAATHFLRRVELRDVNGTVSTFTFRAITANTGLTDDLFLFTVPKGVDVITAPMPVQP